MNKKSCQALISELANKEEGERYPDGQTVIITDPVMIGDVLEKMGMKIELTGDILTKTVGLWLNCGRTKSLNQIMQDSGFENIECIDPSCKCGKFPLRNDKCEYKEQLKDPNARALFEFLQTVFNFNK